MGFAKCIHTAIIPLIIGLLVAGCGGGGGGSDSGGVNYTGVSSRAVVSDANAGDFGEAAAAGPEMGFGLQELGGVGMVGGGRLAVARLVAARTMQYAEEGRAAARSAALAIGPEEGDCGGSISGDFEFVGASPFDLNANMLFTDYNDCSTEISGRVVVQMRLQGTDTLQISESFSGLVVDDGQEMLRIGGTIAVTADLQGDGAASVVLNFAVENVGMGEQIWFDDLRIGVTEDFVSETVTLEGRIYHSDHGYVDVTTDPAGTLAAPYTIATGAIAPLVIAAGNDHPHSGGLLMVGEAGTAALLQPIDATQYQIILDTDGDGTIGNAGDLVLGPVSWN